ncbi:MAG: hypothetical protein SH856_11450 [Flavobacteriales bacterium]|mgnify:CR=1 FL=1|nr:hypothetical protein [Flavobacteriales bacterium]
MKILLDTIAIAHSVNAMSQTILFSDDFEDHTVGEVLLHNLPSGGIGTRTTIQRLL